jgi:hypothetical protein
MRPVLLVCLAVSLACGSSSSQPGAGSGAPTGDAGGGPSADGGPVGQPADAGAPAADGGQPAADAGAPDAGGPAGGGGDADAGASDGGTAGGPVPDAGAADPECDGLGPQPVGPPNGTHTMQADRVDCVAAVTGTGALALQMTNPQNGALHFVGPDGQLRSSTPAGTNTVLLGRLSSFEGFAYTHPPGSATRWVAQTYDDRGTLLAQGPERPGFPTVVEDPLGGIALLPRDGPAAIENYDDRGKLRWRVELSRQITAIGGFAVDRLGNTFVMGDSSAFDKTVIAQWIDHEGVASPAFQLLGPQREWNHLAGYVIVRVGSGLFVHADEWWQLQSNSTSVEPPPAWFIAAHPEMMHGMQMVRNGRAYGIISSASGADCTSTVEIMTASGKSCGKASFSAGPAGGSAPPSCFSGSTLIGYDGTFVQRVPPPPNVCTGGVCSCTWHWWTGFFR